MMSEQPAPKKRKSFWIIFLYTLIPVAILIGGAFIFDQTGKNKLNRALSEARKIGPTSQQELEAARKAWPEEKNGALVIVALQPKLSKTKNNQKILKLIPIVGDANLPKLGRRWDKETNQAVASFLHTISKELTKIDTIRDYPGGHFPIEYAYNPVFTKLPNLSTIRQVARLKSLQIHHHTINNKNDTLLDDLAVMEKVSQLLADEPFLISALVCVAIDALTVSTIEDVCAHTTLSPRQLIEIKQLLLRLESKNYIHLAHLFAGYQIPRPARLVIPRSGHRP